MEMIKMTLRSKYTKFLLLHKFPQQHSGVSVDKLKMQSLRSLQWKLLHVKTQAITSSANIHKIPLDWKGRTSRTSRQRHRSKGPTETLVLWLQRLVFPTGRSRTGRTARAPDDLWLSRTALRHPEWRRLPRSGAAHPWALLRRSPAVNITHVSALWWHITDCRL